MTVRPTTPPTLTDGVVTLRGHRPSDVDGVLAQSLDPQSREWTRVPLDYTREMAGAFVGEVMPSGWRLGVEHGFALEVDGRYGATMSLRDEGDGRWELAYGAHPDVRGTGAVLRGLRLLVAWGFEVLEAQSIVWRAHVGNWASRKTAWRLGFALEGTLRSYLDHRGVLRDCWVATLLPADPREPARPWLTVPVLEADGLRLRPWRDSDVPRIVEACSDPETQAWLRRLPSPYDEVAAHAYLESRTEQLATGDGLTWAVVDPADDVALASMGLFDLTPAQDVELGYWAHPDARGRGVTTRAARRAVEHAFAELGVRRVKAFAADGNIASRRVLEACGMTHTGTERLGAEIRAGLTDLALYDVLATEWRSP